MAVTLAMGEVPPAAVVKSAVKAYLQQKYPPVNPFSEDQVCRIVGGVPGKQNCWCVVAEVRPTECVVDTWDNQYVVAVDDLSSMRFTKAEEEQMLDLGERMTALYEVGDLDEAALWLLQGLERLNRSQLNSLEERLLGGNRRLLQQGATNGCKLCLIIVSAFVNFQELKFVFLAN